MEYLKRQNKIHSIKHILKRTILISILAICICSTNELLGKNEMVTTNCIPHTASLRYIEIDDSIPEKSLANNNYIGGNGTKEDPYVLSNYNFYRDDWYPIISIKNTRAFLVIENCKLRANYENSGIFIKYESNGIQIENSSNIVINNCTFESSGYGSGCSFSNSSNILVKNCQFDCLTWGIYCEYSSLISITDNEIIGKDCGVAILGSSSIFVEKNTIKEGYHGILSSNSTMNNYTDNLISDNYIGMSVKFSVQALITANRIFSNQYGLDIVNSIKTTIIGNVIKKNKEVGIILHSCLQNDILDNQISYSKWGIIFQPKEEEPIYAHLSIKYENIDNLVKNNTLTEIYRRGIIDSSGKNELVENSVILSLWWLIGLPIATILIITSSIFALRSIRKHIEELQEIKLYEKNSIQNERIKELEEELKKYKELYDTLIKSDKK
ncbi:NosD domain-containing protein [Candidatus Lokiarchaeum ossiferum]|uniref:NosD domain-containing protein n=1 Tax=Candidatus Lokiarchaeum ossiferum TaxID=2951803 RepID=UPI00352C6E90